MSSLPDAKTLYLMLIYHSIINRGALKMKVKATTASFLKKTDFDRYQQKR